MAGGDKRKGGGGMEEEEAAAPLEEEEGGGGVDKRRGKSRGRDRKMKDGGLAFTQTPRGPSADCVFIRG